MQSRQQRLYSFGSPQLQTAESFNGNLLLIRYSGQLDLQVCPKVRERPSRSFQGSLSQEASQRVLKKVAEGSWW